MPQMSMIEAIRDAMDVKMSQDPDVLTFGEDVGYFGGVFRCTAGLQEKHGLHRCFDTPISEARPSMPSSRFSALMQPTSQPMVSGMPSHPSSIG